MSKKIFLLIILLFTVIFSHFYNKHKIMIYKRQITRLYESYKSYKEVNLFLINQNCKLNSRERIQKLAFEKLDMIYPEDNQNVYTIKMDRKKETFCLIDYIVPSVEALND
ncbi:MAG: hypothetical protein KAT74_09605 [Candidatus Cloacimonetes bacterium]|nr:hypothetical protein [Candidatus Cloacimonadota bacterium]